MSARQVAYSQLVCDGCSVVYENIGRPVAHLRELAAGDGWKHEAKRYASSNWCKQVDLCPKCHVERKDVTT